MLCIINPLNHNLSPKARAVPIGLEFWQNTNTNTQKVDYFHLNMHKSSLEWSNYFDWFPDLADIEPDNRR
jgi:hypothetical protein